MVWIIRSAKLFGRIYAIIVSNLEIWRSKIFVKKSKQVVQEQNGAHYSQFVLLSIKNN